MTAGKIPFTEKKRWAPDLIKVFKEATREAIQGHLQAGNPVYFARNHKLIEKSPDGTEKVVKILPEHA